MCVTWNLISVRLETVLVSVRDRCTVCAKAQKPFWTHSMVLVGDVGHVESRFGPFENDVTVGVR
jgi:hypothetical protein